jgi:hypothetical protein
MLANVAYNRSNRSYAVTHPQTGDVAHFPSGAHGRRQAFQTAVEMTDPELYQQAGRIIARHPHLESRVWRAVELVIADHVQAGQADLYVATVGSQSEYGNYTLTYDSHGRMTCDCQDYTDFTAPVIEGSLQPHCKHILAWKLYAATKLPY